MRTIHDSTGFSPYYLIFGRHPKLAIDALLRLPGNSEQNKSRNKYVRKLRKRFSFAYKRAKEAAMATGKDNKRQFDVHVSAKDGLLKPGDYALLRNVTMKGK